VVTIFGTVSVIVFIASVTVSILYTKVMRLKDGVDEAFAEMDEILATESVDAENDYTEQLEKSVQKTNKAIDDYNKQIKKFPGSLIAMLVGLKKEDNVQLI